MQSFGKRGQLAAVDFEEGGSEGGAQSAQVEMDLLLTPHARAALSLGAAKREGEREIIGTEREINKRAIHLMDLRHCMVVVLRGKILS